MSEVKQNAINFEAVKIGLSQTDKSGVILRLSIHPLELREYMSVSKATLWRIVKTDDRMPKSYKVGERGVRWKKSEIDQWLEQTRD